MGGFLRVILSSLSLALASLGAQAADGTTFEVESKIPLGAVHGRIDHLAVDLGRRRLYVAELGNDSVGVVDLKEHQVIRTLTGLAPPQGVGYAPSTDTLYVANAGDGSVRLFRGAELTPAGQIALGSDADNIRVDNSAQRIFVGYGSGALAVIDAVSQTRSASIPLKAHPEGFQLERNGQRLFVNVPDAGEIAVVDRATNRQVASWPTQGFKANFPLALDELHGRIVAVFRNPARLAVFSETDGRLLTTLDTCADSDDVFVDSKRDRVYVICGEGFVDVFAAQGERYANIGRLATSTGARTALYIPEIDRLVVAVRAIGATSAAVWVLRPMP